MFHAAQRRMGFVTCKDRKATQSRSVRVEFGKRSRGRPVGRFPHWFFRSRPGASATDEFVPDLVLRG